MSIRVFVNDEDISQGGAWVRRDGWSITNYSFGNINFARFVVMDPLKSFTPPSNAEVRIVDGAGNVLFGGTISRKPRDTYLNDDGLGRRWNIEAHGWMLRLEHGKDISGVYTGRTDAQIIAAPTSDEATGSPPGLIHLVNTTTPFKFRAGVVEASAVAHGVFPLEYKNPAGVIDDLAGAAGFVWWIDHDRRVHYRAQHSIPQSPLVFSDTPTSTDEECYDVKDDEDISAIINEVLIIGGYGASQSSSIVFPVSAGDIQVGALSLLYYWNPTYTDGVLDTKFERNTEPDATKTPVWETLNVATSETADDDADVVWHIDRQVLEFKADTFHATNNALRVTGSRLTLITSNVRDADAIEALGGEVFREVVHDESLVSQPRIDGLAQSILNQSRNASYRVTLKADRFVAPAERVRIISSALDLDEVLLVEQVDIEPDGANEERYSVQLVRLAPAIV